MSACKQTLAVACCVVLAAATGSAAQRDLGREVLAANDGFASIGEGITGGASADAAHVFVVRTRAELVAALNAAPAGVPRIIYVDGVIDVNVDDGNGRSPARTTTATATRERRFWPSTTRPAPWGPNPPANTPGSLEAARLASAAAQSARVRMRVPDNTTIVGTDTRATLRGVWLDLRGTATSGAATSSFATSRSRTPTTASPPGRPTGTPTAAGRAPATWDAEYDAISLRETEHVWIDHNEFRDRRDRGRHAAGALRREVPDP